MPLVELIQRNGYHYLKHSYRSGKKVVTKERYLGKTIPHDIEKITSDFLRSTKNELYAKLDSIRKKFRNEWRIYPPSVKKELLANFSVNFTYNTNAIEGSTLSFEDTEDILKRKIAPNKPLRDVQETILHAKTFFSMLNEKGGLTNTLLCQWHHDIFQETKPDIAGAFRNYNVAVGNYRCPDWQDVDRLMAEFMTWYRSKDGEHPVELAARAHYIFVKIHPFGDGNGRIARLLTNFVLHKHHFPLVIIPYVKRKSYYLALRHADKKGEEAFVRYFMRRYLSQHKKYIGKNA